MLDLKRLSAGPSTVEVAQYNVTSGAFGASKIAGGPLTRRAPFTSDIVSVSEMSLTRKFINPEFVPRRNSLRSLSFCYRVSRL